MVVVACLRCGGVVVVVLAVVRGERLEVGSAFKRANPPPTPFTPPRIF